MSEYDYLKRIEIEKELDKKNIRILELEMEINRLKKLLTQELLKK